MTDDGVRCALEYNCIRWGSHDLPPQAGLGVYERGPDGLLARPASTTTSKRPSNSPEARWPGAMRVTGRAPGQSPADLAAVDVQDLAGNQRR